MFIFATDGTAGQTLWSTTGSVCLASLDPSFLPAKAFLQGVRLGLHHAESLGIVSLKYPVPSASLISQVSIVLRKAT